MGATTRSRRLLGVVLTAGTLAGAAATAHAAEPVYRDPTYSFAERAADLVARMTPQEKASQAVSSVSPAIPRLGVEQFAWWNEALHGVARYGYRDDANPDILRNTTSYPISQSLGASWDPALVHHVASEIGDEARETAPGNRLDLSFYSPTINLARDPRWGRTDESFSEDPLLTTKLGEQFVAGMEGKDAEGRLPRAARGYAKTLTTIKHYAANNSEVNRLTGSSDMDDRTLREYYTRAFRDIVRDVQPGSVMTAYNAVNGTPMAANGFMIDTLLRQTFGFEGFVTSDCDGVFEITNGHRWQPPGAPRPLNVPERQAWAMAAGGDLECQQGYHDAFNNRNQLPGAIDAGIRTPQGTFGENDLDASLVRLFTARMRLGEFDDPGRVPWIGAARRRLPGGWTNSDDNLAVTQTPERLKLARKAGARSIVLLKDDDDALPLEVPASGDYRVLVLGQLADPAPDQVYLGGYSAIQGAPGQANTVTGLQGIRRAVQAINPSASVTFRSGFVGLDDDPTAEELTQVDPAALADAGDYDAVVVYAGTDGDTANEDGDRQAITLPGAQDQLIRDAAAANPTTVAYLETIGPMDVSAYAGLPGLKGLLWSSYNGQRKGEALADVLLGRTNPSGRLPETWHANAGQLPAITDYAIRPGGGSPGRTYQYFTGAPAYAFGTGLSYTRFAYSDATVSASSATADDTVQARVTVANTGDRAGRDVVQLYASTPDAPAAAQRPRKRLAGFTHVSLDPGQRRTVTIPVRLADLAFYDEAAKRLVVDPGRLRLSFAHSAADADAQGGTLDVQVSGTLTPRPETVTAKPVALGDRARGVQQRVGFPQGTAILPQLTVALNDDTLVGHRAGGSDAQPLPAGLRVRYASDDPGVVSVGRDGRLRTRGQGVATVTATVSGAGETRRTSFVARVLPRLAGIAVDGRPIGLARGSAPFADNRFDYDVVVGALAPRPRVTARSAGPGSTVRVTQATGVPGTATVVATGRDGTTSAYRVHLARPARSDEFAGARPGPQWTILRPDPATGRVQDGAWTVTPEPGDLRGATNTARNVLSQPAAGNWTVQTTLDLGVTDAEGREAGLLAAASEDRFLVFGVRTVQGVRQLTLASEDDRGGSPVTLPLSDTAADDAVGDATTLRLRLRKSGPRLQASVATVDGPWQAVYETGFGLRDLRVGLYAFAGARATAAAPPVAFERFGVSG